MISRKSTSGNTTTIYDAGGRTVGRFNHKSLSVVMVTVMRVGLMARLMW